MSNRSGQKLVNRPNSTNAHIVFALGSPRNPMHGHHNPGPLHPLGRAVGLRTLQLSPPERLQVFNKLKASLSPVGFDVIWQAGARATSAASAAHFHVDTMPRAVHSVKSPTLRQLFPYSLVRLASVRPSREDRQRSAMPSTRSIGAAFPQRDPGALDACE
jgi:hypothetical protein